MIEPAAYGAAVSFGPNTRNFRDIVAQLLSAEAAVVVHDGDELTAFVERCLVDANYASELGRRSANLSPVSSEPRAAPSICSSGSSSQQINRNALQSLGRLKISKPGVPQGAMLTLAWACGARHGSRTCPRERGHGTQKMNVPCSIMAGSAVRRG